MNLRVLALMLLACGGTFLGLGIYSSQLTERAVEAVTGRPDHTMLYFVGGIALLISGAGLLLSRHSSK